MSALNFPSSPIVGQLYEHPTAGVYEWNGYAWLSRATVPSSMPKGGIIIWSGLETNIPSGWAICDGNNGTPNLRDRFVLCAGAGAVNPVHTAGGSSSATLSIANMPSHSHSSSASISGNISGTTSAAGAHNHSIYDPGHTHPVSKYASLTGISGANPLWANDATSTTSAAMTGISINGVGDHSHTFSGTISGGNVTIAAEGGGQAFSIMPPFYSLAFIMKL